VNRELTTWRQNQWWERWRWSVAKGSWVRGTELKFPRFSETEADDF